MNETEKLVAALLERNFGKNIGTRYPGNEAAQMRAEEVIGEIAIVIAPLVEKLGIENKTVKKRFHFYMNFKKINFVI